MEHKKRTWLGRMRKVKGLSQDEVAKLVHIDRSYYSKIENGLRAPSEKLAEDLADLLGFHYSVFGMEKSPFFFALRHSKVVLAHFDLNLRYTWLFNPHADFDPVLAVGRTDVEMEKGSGSEELMQMKQEVISRRQTMSKKIVFTLSDGDAAYDVTCHPLFNARGVLIGGSTAAIRVPVCALPKVHS
ncbi:helix-turn-helix transcriptional regulator [Rossellomorea sp. RS05]|uniref:helix-turn-helix transcriptional regulator n=1 Tax=Rossellomorea sp. RS05 TaxID=3149166 RepID=UPI0032215AB7